MDLLRDVEQVGHVQQRGRLLAHGPHHLGVTVAQGRHRDPAGEVEILPAVGVPHARAIPSDEASG